MEVPEELLCLFSAEVEADGDSYRIEIPAREVTEGDLQLGEAYRVALLASDSDSGSSAHETTGQSSESSARDPPIAEGDRRIVDIDDIGKRGDGIARVERGYVVIVPETEIGDRVKIEIENVQETLAFGEVIEHVDPTVHE
ncbi:TRAM domain-containing protein [Saliphagus infecundisoli]|uniref:TRAM domain-containing protein n=1 Tax=Saliphagus infecundisoli TaxID=1849069 RepID=A0ABD5QL56_9EURY|nr:TRAM domain-containing protein [Saliphagus infecundisoli]